MFCSLFSNLVNHLHRIVFLKYHHHFCGCRVSIKNAKCNQASVASLYGYVKGKNFLQIAWKCFCWWLFTLAWLIHAICLSIFFGYFFLFTFFQNNLYLVKAGCFFGENLMQRWFLMMFMSCHRHHQDGSWCK